MSYLGLDEKVVVVTGGGQGIGAAYVERLIHEGSTVVVADLNGDRAAEVARRAEGPGEAVAFECDVASRESCRDLARFVGEAYERVDGLINNAAVFATIEMKPFWEITDGEWDRLMAVNLRGPWLVTTCIMPLLRNSAAASVVNIGSDAVGMGRPRYLHYTASKGGVQGMTYGMSHELGELGIRVNTLSPGPVYTEVKRETVTPGQREAMLAAQALHRSAGPEDMTALAAFLISDDSAYITGQTISVNGGLYHR